MMKRLLVAGVVAFGFAGAALAADEPENLIKYRQNIMKANSAHLAALTGIVRGEVSFNDDAAEHARSLQEMSKTIAAPFDAAQTDNTKYKTRAKPEIWSNKADFKKAIENFQSATANLVKVSQASDKEGLTKAVAAVGQACGGCHKPYRAEQ